MLKLFLIIVLAIATCSYSQTCSDPCISRLGYKLPCPSNAPQKVSACYSAYYGNCRPSITKSMSRCKARARAVRKNEELAKARKKQEAKRVAKAEQMLNTGNGISLIPGPRGNLGHSKRCLVAGDDRITSLLQDRSDRAWVKNKKLWTGIASLAFKEEDFQGNDWIKQAENKCRGIATDVAKVKFVNSIGGENIEDLLKKNCELAGNAESAAESGLLGIIKWAHGTPVGEYLSIAFSSNNTSKDYCAMVCRKNKSGIRLKACVIGCEETLEPNCWSQCDLPTCKRGCVNAFPNILFGLFNKKRRFHCYKRCESKCTF